MRELVEQRVVYQFNQGLREIGLSYIDYARVRGGVAPLAHVTRDIEGYVVPTDINLFVKDLTDEELLVALDGQACEKYR